MRPAAPASAASCSRTAPPSPIDGLDGRLPQAPLKFFMGNAGTAMRPLTAALAVLGGDFELSRACRHARAPHFGDLVDALRQLGWPQRLQGQCGLPALHIGQPAVTLHAPIKVRGDVSSQSSPPADALPLVASRTSSSRWLAS